MDEMKHRESLSDPKNILAIIPARAGSTRVPGKNKKLLAGKELIRYVIEATINAQEVNVIVVSSDDKQILAIAAEYQKVIPLERPAEISGDTALAITYVQHTLNYLGERGYAPFDYVAIIQPSSPFTLGEDIDHTIRLLYKNNADSAVSVMKVDHSIHPVKLKVLVGPELKPYFEDEDGKMAAHELPDLYVRNCSVYVSTLKTIEEGKIIGPVCLGYLMPRERSLDINDPVDFEFAEFLQLKHNKA